MLRILNKIDLSIKLKESNSIDQYYKNIMHLSNQKRVVLNDDFQKKGYSCIEL
jgi:hypothetical protein